MHVLVDATPLLVRSAGVKNYLYHWIEHLRRAAAPGESIRTFPPLEAGVALRHDRSVADSGVLNGRSPHWRHPTIRPRP
jgi:hypothetical protein